MVKKISSHERFKLWYILTKSCLMKLNSYSTIHYHLQILLNIVKFSQLEPILFIEQVWKNFILLIFSSLLCLINSYFLITKCLILHVLCKEKLGVDNWLGLNGLMLFICKLKTGLPLFLNAKFKDFSPEHFMQIQDLLYQKLNFSRIFFKNINSTKHIHAFFNKN